MKFTAPFALAAVVFAAPVLADDHAATGDVAAGEAAFNKQCVSCHVVMNEAGETLAGKKAKTGPNLYGVVGRPVATVDGFRYGKKMAAYGETGVSWTEENFKAFVMDPRGFLKEVSPDAPGGTAMSARVKAEEDAINLYAFLASFSAE